MFEDKKLKITFLLALSFATIPVAIFGLGNMFESVPLIYISLGLAIVGLATGTYTLITFIKNWKLWEKLSFKVIGLILSIVEIFIGIYALLGLISLLIFTGPAMIG